MVASATKKQQLARARAHWPHRALPAGAGVAASNQLGDTFQTDVFAVSTTGHLMVSTSISEGGGSLLSPYRTRALPARRRGRRLGAVRC